MPKYQGDINNCGNCHSESTSEPFKLTSTSYGDSILFLYICESCYDVLMANNGWSLTKKETHICQLVCKCNPREAVSL